MTGTSTRERRRLGWFGLVALMLTFFFLPATISVIVLGSQSERLFPDLDSAIHLLQVHGIGLAIMVVAVSALRWWQPVWRERLGARRWAWAPGATIVIVAVAMADYGRMGDAGAAIVGILLLGTVTIAVGEELLFRGVMLEFLRTRTRLGELGVMLVSSVTFGFAHIVASPVQVFFSTILGVVLYTARRVSGGLLWPIVIHFAWDFSVFTSFLTSDPAEGSDASFALALVNIVGAIAILALWKKVAPKTEAVAVVSDGDRS